jgi:hypothetical protein
MDDVIRQAIADLAALIEGADSRDAERICEIIERLQNFDAHLQCSLEWTARLHKKFYRSAKCRE